MAGLLVSVVLGVTGTGGTLVTPILVPFLGVGAVPSRLVVSLLMKPLRSFVPAPGHGRHAAGPVALRGLGAVGVRRCSCCGRSVTVALTTMVLTAWMWMRQHARQVATGVSPTVEVEG